MCWSSLLKRAIKPRSLGCLRAPLAGKAFDQWRPPMDTKSRVTAVTVFAFSLIFNNIKKKFLLVIFLSKIPGLDSARPLSDRGTHLKQTGCDKL